MVDWVCWPPEEGGQLAAVAYVASQSLAELNRDIDAAANLSYTNLYFPAPRMSKTSRTSTGSALAIPIHIGLLNIGWCPLSSLLFAQGAVTLIAQPPFRSSCFFSEVHLPEDRHTKGLRMIRLHSLADD